MHDDFRCSDVRLSLMLIFKDTALSVSSFVCLLIFYLIVCLFAFFFLSFLAFFFLSFFLSYFLQKCIYQSLDTINEAECGTYNFS